MTLLETWLSAVPVLSFFHIFGLLCWVVFVVKTIYLTRSPFSSAFRVILLHLLYMIAFVTQQVVQISRRAVSAQILVKRGTESRFWAFVGVQRKWKKRRLRFVAFMLYWGRVLASAFWGKKNFLHPPVWQDFDSNLFQRRIEFRRTKSPVYLSSAKKIL